MSIAFLAPSPWNAIKDAAKDSRAYIAVPFLGKGAAGMLPIASGSVLVTRFTKDAVKAGQVDPREVIKLIRRGVSVFNQPDLHAKIYVFPRRSFIGSANASKTSAGLIEACIETTESSIVHAARNFVRSLDSDLITFEYANSMVQFYPKDGERYFGVPSKSNKQKTAERTKFWITSVVNLEFSAELRKVDREGTRKAKVALTDATKNSLQKLVWRGKLEFQTGDWILSRFKVGRGFEFECPERVVHIEPVTEGRGKTAIVYLERIKRQKKISSRALRADHQDLVEKLCYSGDRTRRLIAADDVVRVRRLWSAFRA